MSREVYRYTFDASVDLNQVESSLVLAIMSTESLHGESQAKLDIQHLLDHEQRRCVIDAGTPSGRDLNLLLVGYLRREFGAKVFRVERMDGASHATESPTFV